MQKETITEHLKRYHLGEQSAVASRELEAAFGIRGKELRNLINTLRRSGEPIASSGNGYFYAATEQEIHATIAHMTHRISGIAAAIRGLTMALERFDTAQMRLPESLITRGGAQRSGSAAKRTSSGMSESCRLREDERYEACEDAEKGGSG